MNKAIAKAGERLDQIIYSNYGTLEVFEQVLEVNPHLLKKEILEIEDIVYLPNVVLEKVKKEDVLW